MESDLIKNIRDLFLELEKYNTHERIDLINEIKKDLSQYSPMKNEPVDCVIWVKADEISANDYNPNSVAPPEMKLLKLSILQDGYTQPIVAWKKEDETYEVVDGFHRHKVGKEVKAVSKRIMNRLPISIINIGRTGKEDRIASTIRHNRARGKHNVDAMGEIVLDLAKRNWSDKKIADELGMCSDEVLRLKQITGLAEMFSDEEFSKAWE